jgi:hypothetical protein
MAVIAAVEFPLVAGRKQSRLLPGQRKVMQHDDRFELQESWPLDRAG